MNKRKSHNLKPILLLAMVIAIITCFGCLVFAEESVIQQSNLNNDTVMLNSGGWLYGIGWNPSSGMPQLTRRRMDGTQREYLKSGHAFCLSNVGSYIYYIEQYEGELSLFRASADGSARTRVLGNCRSYQIYDNSIYYVRADNQHVYRCDINGRSSEAILNKPCYFVFISNIGMMYQDDRDNESIHICDPDGGNDRKLNDSASYWPTYDGSYIYYVSVGKEIRRMSPTGENDRLVSRCNVSNGMIINDRYIFFIDGDASDTIYRIDKDGSGLLKVSTGRYNLNLCFVGNWYIGYYKYVNQSYDYVSKVYLTDFEGNIVIEFK